MVPKSYTVLELQLVPFYNAKRTSLFDVVTIIFCKIDFSFDENGSGTISVNAGGSSASARTNSRLISSFFRESMRHNNRLYQNSAKLTSTNINNNNNNRDNINNINNNNNNVENLSFSSTESLTESSVKDEEEEVVVVLDYPSGVI